MAQRDVKRHFTFQSLVGRLGTRCGFCSAQAHRDKFQSLVGRLGTGDDDVRRPTRRPSFNPS